jgi:hypothetical protein
MSGIAAWTQWNVERIVDRRPVRDVDARSDCVRSADAQRIGQFLGGLGVHIEHSDAPSRVGEVPADGGPKA